MVTKAFVWKGCMALLGLSGFLVKPVIGADKEECIADPSGTFSSVLSISIANADSASYRELAQLEEQMVLAYDTITGLTCDPCQRRLVRVEILEPNIAVGRELLTSEKELQEQEDLEEPPEEQQQFPAASPVMTPSRRLNSHFSTPSPSETPSKAPSDMPSDAPSDSPIDIDLTITTTFTVRFVVEQTGDCDTVFDNTVDDSLFTDWDTDTYFSACGSGFVTYTDLRTDPSAAAQTAECCCLPGGYSRKLQPNPMLRVSDFLRILNGVTDSVVAVEILEYARSEVDFCDPDAAIRTFTNGFDIDCPGNIPNEALFQQLFADAYNSLALENCYPQFMIAPVTDNDLRRRRLSNHFWSIGCNACPDSCVYPGFCGRRRLGLVEDMVEVDTNPNLRTRELAQDFEHAMRGLQAMPTLPIPSSVAAEQCLCAVGGNPSNMRPTPEEHRARFNELLEASDETFCVVQEITVVETFNIEQPTVTETVRVPIVITGSASCGAGNQIASLASETYNDLSFELCDPIFRQISSATFTCEGTDGCDASNEVRGTLELEVTAFRRFPKDELFGKARDLFESESRSGSRRRGNGRGGGSGSRELMTEEDRDLQEAVEAFCSPAAVGFTAPCRSAFLEDFATNLANAAHIIGVDGVRFFFDPCEDSSRELQITNSEARQLRQEAVCGLTECHGKSGSKSGSGSKSRSGSRRRLSKKRSGGRGRKKGSSTGSSDEVPNKCSDE